MQILSFYTHHIHLYDFNSILLLQQHHPNVGLQNGERREHNIYRLYHYLKNREIFSAGPLA